jgi:retron-type reverse transcriptase
MSEAKPFSISKREVWEAYKRVRANQGAAGVDEQSIADFERNLKGNLYKIWNRMSSGRYFPPPVRTVKIPKANGGERKLGIPTVADRIAQQVVKSRLEPAVDPLFHPDSYGYRPGKSALDAVGQARQRCWRSDWIVDLDIKGFFDNIPQDLLLRAVKKRAKDRWVVLYVERWLKAPVQEEDGQLVPFTGRRSIRRCGNWIALWSAGPTGNTRSCEGICAGRHIGSREFRAATRNCGRTGRWACGVALSWEPYERRRSRTVL